MEPLKVLLATDGSSEAAAAGEVLNLPPLPAGSAVRVLSVVDVPQGAFGGRISATMLELVANEEWAQADRAVERLQEALARPGLAVSSTIRNGDPAQEILQAAEEFHADLIAVGSKGRAGLAGLLVGSVARTVAKRSSRPVLVARPPRAGLRQVVVATDGSEHAEHAVRFSARLPLPDAAQVTVVHVVRPFTPFPGPLRDPVEAFQAAVVEVQRRQEEAGAALLAEAKRLLAAEGRQAETALRVGDPATELLALAEERQADLILAGARGASFVEGLLMGSVSDRLLKEAPCSVLIVR